MVHNSPSCATTTTYTLLQPFEWSSPQPYLYALAGAAAKTQAAVRKIGREEYDHTATGLSGNEDCGQMSAWYLFSALGFYPLDPASGTYVLAAPFFDRLELQLPTELGEAPETQRAQRTITVVAHGASEGKRYVRGVKVNGREWGSVVLHHKDIQEGVEIEFDMADRPQAWPEK